MGEIVHWQRKAGRAAEVLRRDGFAGVTALAAQRLGELRTEQSLRVRRASRRALEFGIRPHILRGRVRHVHGPAEFTYGPRELLLLCVVRNGAPYLESFLEHYDALGVARYVFLDNGSTDGTCDRLCVHPRVTLLRADVPYARYENTMKRYLADRFSAGRWHLCADIDELFDYPSSRELPLSSFLGYLDAHGFTAVVAQMLDLFADRPLSKLQRVKSETLKATYQYFDVSAVERCPYEWAESPRPEIKMHWGGVRRAVFGTDNGMTKAPLVKMDGRTRPFVEWHQTSGAVLADVTGVLMHYPFTSGFRDKAIEAARSGRYGGTTTSEYVAYAKALTGNPDLNLKGPGARRFIGLEPLIAERFLVVSTNYLNWVSAHGQRTGGQARSADPFVHGPL